MRHSPTSLDAKEDHLAVVFLTKAVEEIASRMERQNITYSEVISALRDITLYGKRTLEHTEYRKVSRERKRVESEAILQYMKEGRSIPDVG